MAAQFDIFGLPVLPREKREAGGPSQGLLLLDDEACIRQRKDRSRLQQALQHFGAAVALLWKVDAQKYQVPPSPPEVLRDALTECRNLRGQLEQIEASLEDALSEGGEDA